MNNSGLDSPDSDNMAVFLPGTLRWRIATLFGTEVSAVLARADIQTNELLDPFNLELPDEKPLLHFASKLDVVIWPAERIVK